MKKILNFLPILFIFLLISSCEKNVVEYDTTPVGAEDAEFQLHYFVPLTTGTANNIYQVELDGKIIASNSSPLSVYNAIPSGSVGRFYTANAGSANLKLYKGTNKELVYDQTVTLIPGKQNIFVYDFDMPPIVFENGFPYPKNTTENTDTTAWVKFYNFLFETADTPTDLKLQYQYQYVMDVGVGTKSEWINVGEPVAFGESTGWESITVIKAVEVSSGSARIDYRVRLIGEDGSDQGSLKVMNSSSAFINYSDWWTAFVGRAYHHVLSGMRADKPVSAVRVFTAL